MKLDSKLFYFSGFLSYLIFKGLFEIMSGIVKISLIFFDLNKTLFWILIIIASILSLVIFNTMFRYLFKQDMTFRLTVKLSCFALLTFLINTGLNKLMSYISLLDSSKITPDNMVFLIYPNFVYPITLVFGILLLYLFYKGVDNGSE